MENEIEPGSKDAPLSIEEIKKLKKEKPEAVPVGKIPVPTGTGKGVGYGIKRMFNLPRGRYQEDDDD